MTCHFRDACQNHAGMTSFAICHSRTLLAGIHATSNHHRRRVDARENHAGMTGLLVEARENHAGMTGSLVDARENHAGMTGSLAEAR